MGEQKDSAGSMGFVDWPQVGKHIVFALVVGVVSAFASIVLCLCVSASYGIFSAHPWLLWLLPVLGVVSLLLYKWWKLDLDMTTHHVVVDMAHDKPVSPLLAPGVLLGTCLTILGGGSVGKEAGALQMGASLGSLVSRPFHLKSVHKADADQSMNGYAAATGMAATFAALFFAPLGSAMFVLEFTRYRKNIAMHTVTIVIACFAAFFIANIFGIGDVIDKVAIPEASWRLVGQCAVIGLAGALAGSFFSSAITWVHDLTWRVCKNYFVWVIVGGLLFAVLVNWCGWMPFTGSGGNTLGDVLHGHFEPWDFAVKLLLTLICLGFWFKGGEIMPSFCIGGLLGAACTYLTGGDPCFGAAIGVMAFFAAFSRCPLAAFLMGCEIFGWAAAPWLAIAVFVAMIAGSSVGFYGVGVDEAIRMNWRDMLSRSLNRKFDERYKSDVVSDGKAAAGEPDMISAIHHSGVLPSIRETVDRLNAYAKNPENRDPSEEEAAEARTVKAWEAESGAAAKQTSPASGGKDG